MRHIVKDVSIKHIKFNIGLLEDTPASYRAILATDKICKLKKEDCMNLQFRGFQPSSERLMRTTYERKQIAVKD